jgi:hypothetical protein
VLALEGVLQLNVEVAVVLLVGTAAEGALREEMVRDEVR